MRGDIVHRGEQAVFDTCNTPLPGRHNRGNLCAVLAALEALGLDAVALAPAVQDFRPLPNRLQRIGVADGLTSTIRSAPRRMPAWPRWSVAGQRIALLVGHDRGLDWTDFMQHMAHDVPPVEIVTMGSNGPRIHAMLQPLADAVASACMAGDLAEAMALARAALGEQGGWCCCRRVHRALVRTATTWRGVISPRWPGSIRTASARFRVGHQGSDPFPQERALTPSCIYHAGIPGRTRMPACAPSSPCSCHVIAARRGRRGLHP